MRTFRWAMAALAAVAVLSTASAADKPKKKLLLVTHSGGFIHNSVGTAEDVMKEIGPKNGYEVTCWRFTGDPDAKVMYSPERNAPAREMTALERESDRYRKAVGRTIEKEHCGRVNAESLKKFDAVLFFTTGSGKTKTKNDIGPLTPDELKDLTAWVKAGGAFCGTHCASDTMYDSTYGELIGGYFKTHPPGLHNVKLKIEDPSHPAAVGFTNGQDYKDEIYIFTDTPYSRDKLHVIISCEKGSFKEAKDTRKDGDYAISWCREEGKGKVFYTSLGHQPQVWKDEKFHQHLFGGIAWATGQAKGDATPSNKVKN